MDEEHYKLEIKSLEEAIFHLEEDLDDAQDECRNLEREISRLEEQSLEWDVEFQEILLDYYKAIQRGDSGAVESMYVKDALQARGRDLI